jgi:ribosome-associated protein
MARNLSHRARCSIRPAYLFFACGGRQGGPAFRPGPARRGGGKDPGGKTAAGLGVHPRTAPARIGHGHPGGAGAAGEHRARRRSAGETEGLRRGPEQRKEPTIIRRRRANGSSTRAASDRLLAIVEKSLDDHKAEDVVVIDLHDKSSIADYMVIASGRSQRQIGAMAEHLSLALKEATGLPANIEGAQSCDWVLIDGGDVIVHLFRPDMRSFYNLEKMWGMSLPAPERISAMA